MERNGVHYAMFEGHTTQPSRVGGRAQFSHRVLVEDYGISRRVFVEGHGFSRAATERVRTGL